MKPSGVNLVLLEAADFTGAERVRVFGRRFLHLRNVHRAGVGDELRVGVIDGRLGNGKVTRVDEDSMEMDVALDTEPPAPLPITLVLALPRPKALRRVLQAVAAMGVKRLLLANAWRVEKSFWDSPALHPENIRQELLRGLEQARDTVVPQVSLHRLFKPLVQDVLPALVEGTLGLVADPGAADACPRSLAGAATLAVGPEGGFIPYEVELLQASGFRPVTLGPRILRVEHAVTALLARLAQ